MPKKGIFLKITLFLGDIFLIYSVLLLTPHHIFSMGTGHALAIRYGDFSLLPDFS